MNKGKKEKQIAAIKGTKDILPQEAERWQQAEDVCRRVFELFGYSEIRTPVFEATELFEKGTGLTSDIVLKEMYTFKDKGGRSLTLRPEYTPSIVRAIIEHRLYLQPQPLRFYYIGPMFRYDKPQKGRFRQFHQADIEVFGEEDPALDAEIVQMADFLLGELAITETEILVNSVGCRDCRPAYIEALGKEAKEKEEQLCADCRRKVVANPLRIFDCKIETCREVSSRFPRITDFLCTECDQHFQAFCSYLELYRIPYTVEPRLVRGIDYYTRTTFEIISPQLGAQNAILGGGRYDDMMKDFGGPDLCGIGFAMGMERLLTLVSHREKKEKFLYLVHMGEGAKKVGIGLIRRLREKGVVCQVEYKESSLRNQMGRANKLGASWVLIVGEDEVKKGKYQLKEMSSGEQKECSFDEILDMVRRSP